MFLNNIVNTVRTRQRNNKYMLVYIKKRCFYEVILQHFIYFCKAYFFDCTTSSKLTINGIICSVFLLHVTSWANLLTLLATTSRNGQTRSNHSSATADKLFECVWPFCGINENYFGYYLCLVNIIEINLSFTWKK